MTHAALNAAKVYQACHNVGGPARNNMTPDQLECLGRLADLANIARAEGGDNATIYVSTEDFAMINGHWPQP